MPSVMSIPQNQLIFACLAGIVGVFLLLPKPKRSGTAVGTFLSIASVAAFGHYLSEQFGKPVGQLVPDLLFWLFSAGAVGFSILLVTQRNPARGAISFAFVILSSCGLFLLLAAPFLMAATIIIYAGAIIVTFLFVLMLSHVSGPSDENDRTREPLLGSLGGFAFIGLLLFSLLQSKNAGLPTPPLTQENREQIKAIQNHLDQAISADSRDSYRTALSSAHELLTDLTGDKPGSVMARHRASIRVNLDTQNLGSDAALNELFKHTLKIRQMNDELETSIVRSGPLTDADRQPLKEVRAEVMLYSGHGHLPARNIGNLGYLIFSEQILAVELAGTLLLIATIGTVAIASRRREGVS